MDSSVTETSIKDVKLVQTTDFFYPIVDDPYMHGRITAANVLSDLYALGVYRCSTMLMLLGVALSLPKDLVHPVTRLVMQGFLDTAKEAGTTVSGGQTVKCPWMLTGGVATTVAHKNDIIMPINAQEGDVMVLTKPLGTQIAVTLDRMIQTQDPKYDEHIKPFMSIQDVRDAHTTASESMARLNRLGAKLMHKYNAHAATDITGFGILGHAQNLAGNQLNEVDFVIDALPVIKGLHKASVELGMKLQLGTSPETSGGLLVALSPQNAEQFIQEIYDEEGWEAFVVGHVIRGSRRARLVPEKDMRVIEVGYKNASL